MTTMRHGMAVATAALLLLTACSEAHAVSMTTVADNVTTTTAATTTTQLLTTTSATTTTVAEALPQPVPPPPDPYADEPYNELGTIEIPKLQVVKPLLEGVTLTTLDRGPGHWPGTAMPGHLGNVVIGGHRTSKDRPFRNIDQLVPGDEVILITSEGRFVYKVKETKVVTPESMWIIDQKREHTATLFACHPVGSTKERIVVFLELDQPLVAGTAR